MHCSAPLYKPLFPSASNKPFLQTLKNPYNPLQTLKNPYKPLLQTLKSLSNPSYKPLKTLTNPSAPKL